MRIFSVGISVTDDHFRIIAANLRLDEIAHQKYPHPHCNNMKEMGHFLAADLENLSMYSGYTHSTAHKKAVAEVPAKRLIACCWSERMVQITSGSFSRRLCGVRATV